MNNLNWTPIITLLSSYHSWIFLFHIPGSLFISQCSPGFLVRSLVSWNTFMSWYPETKFFISFFNSTPVVFFFNFQNNSIIYMFSYIWLQGCYYARGIGLRLVYRYVGMYVFIICMFFCLISDLTRMELLHRYQMFS